MLRNIYKRIIQVIWVVIELLLCSLLITYLTSFIEPIMTWWEFIERIIFSYGIYQIVVYIILTNCNDIRKDSYLALLTNYKLLSLYYESSDEKIKNIIHRNVDYQMKRGTLNDNDIRKEYEILSYCIDNKNIADVNMKIIMFEHLVEASTLNWRYSFLLRFIK